ncbi:hypothetical protein HYG86_04130 [Alkalicella caledoniensis]|uniref:Nucleotidase n=1 Tax=Alkalicella caledoniensis TaxID=2731377 RepID=A0A7G9W5Q7_ALKCA|nr:hypothetical protein [Alkalicella caledoniensis]QNO14019.1 hypothetical protein HYG86_04130 [Alkalicella caledoniensis]
MEKLNICIDIDGTLTEPFFLLDRANKHFEKNIKPEDVDSYEIHQLYGVEFKDFFEFYISVANEVLIDVDPRERVREVLLEIDGKHNIHYVTAREDFLTDVTQRWFEKYKLPSGKLHILGSHYKVKTAEQVKCDLFIEDRYNNAIELAEAGFKVLLIDCVYNRKPLIPGITRVNNWEEVNEMIKELETSIIQDREKNLAKVVTV